MWCSGIALISTNFCHCDPNLSGEVPKRLPWSNLKSLLSPEKRDCRVVLRTPRKDRKGESKPNKQTTPHAFSVSPPLKGGEI